MEYFHVDVFSSRILNGNGLTVVFPEKQLNDSIMLKITQEFRQFETIFIMPEHEGAFPVRIFTVDEELDFAGHPMLGAAAVIHRFFRADEQMTEIRLAAGDRKIELTSVAEDGYFNVRMNQGPAEFIRLLNIPDILEIIKDLNLSPADLASGYPVEVVSTGLPYLLLPVEGGLRKAGIRSERFEKLLDDIGAKFVYLFDPETMECRTWDNSGLVEDVATGSAAGPLCGYLVKNGFRKTEEEIIIKQGRYAGRPAVLRGRVFAENGDIFIEGGVAFFAEGEISGV